MKKLFYFLSVGLLLGAFALVGCGDDDDDELSTEDQQLAIMVGTWAPTGGNAGVSLAGSTAPGDWTNTTFTFTSNGNFSIANQPTDEVTVFVSSAPFSTSGSSTTTFQLTIGDDVTTVNVNDNNNITISFTVANEDPIGARTQSINGSWVFDLTRE